MVAKPNIFHVILTRFNLPNGGRESRLRNSENWLKERFEIFEKYCLPSVTNQSDQNFQWFIYFDKNTPEPYKTKALNYQTQFNKISIFWETDPPISKIQAQILEKAPNQATTLVTSRLDNDDMIHTNFLETLKKAVISSEDSKRMEVLNFPNGYILSGNTLYSHTDISNAFASLKEPLSTTIRSVWAEQHVALDKLAPIKQLEDDAKWLQIIHGKNVSNRIRGKRIALSNIELGFISIKNSLRLEDMKSNENWFFIRLENITMVPIRSAYEMVRKIFKLVIHRFGYKR